MPSRKQEFFQVDENKLHPRRVTSVNMKQQQDLVGKCTESNNVKNPKSSSLLKQVLCNNDISQLNKVDQQDMQLPDALLMVHGDQTPSLTLSPKCSTPWTPKSLGRAKTAIVYKQTLNDTLMIMERKNIFFSGWTPYFMSLQNDHIILYECREKWEQGLDPAKVISINHMMYLSDMEVDVEDEVLHGDFEDQTVVVRLFRRKLLEADYFDQWLNEELRESLLIRSGSNVNVSISNNRNASSQTILEFSSYSQSTFELWTKALRKSIEKKKKEKEEFLSSTKSMSNNTSISEWVTPGNDARISSFRSEIWTNRVMEDDTKKASSELRRLVAMEKLVSQIISSEVALLVYEKVSRVHEMFVANSRREIEKKDNRDPKDRISAPILHFFSDHLKRKYAVFLNLVLAFGISEKHIRNAHESMCLENKAHNAGVGGGGEESGAQMSTSEAYGFDNDDCLEVYDKYRVAAVNYYQMNHGDSSSAEEEDAIMHLPVTLHVAFLQENEEEANNLMQILDTVKRRLVEFKDKETPNTD